MLRKVRARRIAEGLLKEFKVKKVPVDIENIAKQLTTKDIRELKGLSLRIQREHFPSGLEDVSAVLLKEKGHAIIAVNAAHSEYRQRFSIAHELGHLILHSNNELLTVDRYEKQFFTRAEGISNLDEMEANEFAAAFLMPSDLIREDFEKYFKKDPDEIISKLAKRYEVSEAALAFRLKNLGLLS
jgi:Zn-dependent peptidase ImmA (M78 family)